MSECRKLVHIGVQDMLEGNASSPVVSVGLVDTKADEEVTLKVHVSDASTHQPVTEAFIEIFTNQISIASGTSGADGTAFLKFQYKLGNQLIVTARNSTRYDLTPVTAVSVHLLSSDGSPVPVNGPIYLITLKDLRLSLDQVS
ncbi:hypothetical protein DV515_00001485 [Chloebia gouldiae]|uniref:FAM171 N-terminal domain-containing protein n=1 Tax=Chloebia gouldiae TaxID=44316 RepID=A0A3L8SZH2_CHLGU|nr:hypothetical protein DV515_00001485 [Chloebia gouldiae]